MTVDAGGAAEVDGAEALVACASRKKYIWVLLGSPWLVIGGCEGINHSLLGNYFGA